jgi:5,10-methylenetetrahydromethanopterin reductase
VFNPYNRHPTLIAMEIGALDELAGGRVRLGIGSGVGNAVERMGLSYARPVTALGEAISIVRALLAGEEVTFAGEVFKVDRVKLDYAPRRDIAIFMAGRGDRSLALCGKRADGLLVSNMCTAAFVARSAALMREAATRAGRTGPLGVVRYMPCGVAEERAEAVAAAKRAVGEMLPTYWRLGQRLEGASRRLLWTAASPTLNLQQLRSGCAPARTQPLCSMRVSLKLLPLREPPRTARRRSPSVARPVSPSWR